jgi:hypothetical protein
LACEVKLFWELTGLQTYQSYLPATTQHMTLVPPAYASSCRLFCNFIRILKLLLDVFRKH